MNMGVENLNALDAPMLLLVIIVTLLASALTGAVANFGWRSVVERNAKLALDLTKLGDMEEEVDALRESIRSRVRQAERRRGTAMGLWSAFSARIPELLVSTSITVLVFTAASAVIGNTDKIASFTVASFIAGTVLHLASAVYAIRKNGGR